MTPLERAARAYHDSTRQFRYVRDCLKPSAPPIARPVPFVEWDDLDEEARAERKKQVCAILTAIREPSIAVVMAGANEVENGDGELHRRKWQAMIGAALSEKPE